jgi:hypothetical protein
VASRTVDAAIIRKWAATLTGPVILPGAAMYESARRVWNLAVDRRPAAIVRCGGVDDIRRTVEFARTQALPLAIRSGGHNQAGHGVCEGGLVIDLAACRTVQVDRSNRLARVAGGARVADLLEATVPRGLITPTGGCADVGVGGLTVGGGESFLMSKYGAVCDNVVSAEMILADGRHVRASAEEHADLFWGVRGGGSNFGVVVSFDYRLYEAHEVLAGQFVFPVDRARDVLLRYRDLMRDVTDDLETSAGLTSTPDGPRFLIALCYGGRPEDGERVVAAWRAALHPAADNIRRAAYSAELTMPAARSTGTGVFLPELTDGVLEAFASAVAEAPAEATAVWNDFHGAVTRVPVDATAFPLRHAGFDLFITAQWQDEQGRRSADAWVRQLAASLRPFGRGVYVNNLEDEGAGRVREAYGPNYARLAALKKKYDPDNVFSVNQNISPTG